MTAARPSRSYRRSARSVPDREQTRRALTEHRYGRHVQADARRAKRLGATGAPFIVADGRYAVPGAQNSDTFLNCCAPPGARPTRSP
ncbi:DsbA family protein [Streptomyces sp. Root369]|uniref:DsbA family oxidoreductase n=1 Tax=Streptomyces sp. Root369 TaxID=1736523 RepID=UPI001F5BF0E9|nr:DsbA family protein [Streptomyces sp. Root369]